MRIHREEKPQFEDTGESSKRLKLLLIEDEPLLRDVLMSFLEKEDYQVFHAGTMREAMAYLENQCIDGVLTDYRLQSNTIDGLLSHIEGDMPELLNQTLLISGHTDFDNRNLPVLRKPFSLVQLGSVISKWNARTK